MCVCVWCTRLSVWQGDPCQGVHGDAGMLARVSVIVPGVHACGECIHVCRSLSVWNVWCLRVHVHICTWGGRGCPCVGCTRVCVFSMFVESTRVCMYSPALADPGPHGRRHSLLFLLILLALPPTPPWSRWVPAGGYIQVSRAPCCPGCRGAIKVEHGHHAGCPPSPKSPPDWRTAAGLDPAGQTSLGALGLALPPARSPTGQIAHGVGSGHVPPQMVGGKMGSRGDCCRGGVRGLALKGRCHILPHEAFWFCLKEACPPALGVWRV